MTLPRILVVDDEPAIAIDLREQLTKLGYEVPDPVATGDHALRTIEKTRPDLILIDVNIPGELDGIATASRIPPAYRIPIIYLTADAEASTLARAGATNPYGYLLKPSSERELHAMIQISLARSRAERATLAARECRWQSLRMQTLGQLASGIADDFHDFLSVIRGQIDGLGHRSGRDKARPKPHAGLPVAWHKSDNALFASVQPCTGGIRYQLIVEQLPRRNAWDWACWRPGDTEDTPRHGRASSVTVAMAAAENSARQWAETDPPSC
jgi:CheY-like chemotaxis protein